ncbi:hypothetical protein [Legionella rowbothamii]|uniref:hypothetical protein n=1 Tax=Legionella rowbothamii TaxID=96229 RepID=UPI001056A9F3|nr:hypothetical protein [Legionella rowbothamii]
MSDNDNKTEVPRVSTIMGTITMNALFPRVEPNYKHTFPRREILHEQAPPHIQSVNQGLDKEGVDLRQNHIEHFKRGMEIDNHKPLANQWVYFHNFIKNAKSIKNETKIANSFYEEYKDEVQKEGANLKTKVYAEAGVHCHTLFGAAKAAQNPYIAHEDDLAIGATMDYYRSHKS